MLFLGVFVVGLFFVLLDVVVGDDWYICDGVWLGFGWVCVVYLLCVVEFGWNDVGYVWDVDFFFEEGGMEMLLKFLGYVVFGVCVGFDYDLDDEGVFVD